MVSPKTKEHKAFRERRKLGAERTGRGSIQRRNGVWEVGRGSGGAGRNAQLGETGEFLVDPRCGVSGPGLELAVDRQMRDADPEHWMKCQKLSPAQQSDGAVVNSAKSATRVDCRIFSASVARAVRGPTASCTRGEWAGGSWT